MQYVCSWIVAINTAGELAGVLSGFITYYFWCRAGLQRQLIVHHFGSQLLNRTGWNALKFSMILRG